MMPRTSFFLVLFVFGCFVSFSTADFVNPGFEYGVAAGSVSFLPSQTGEWQTNDQIQACGDGYLGVTPYEGDNFIELVSNTNGSYIYQTVTLVPNSVYQVYWHMLSSTYYYTEYVTLTISSPMSGVKSISFDNTLNYFNWARASHIFQAKDTTYTIQLAGYSEYYATSGNLIDDLHIVEIFPNSQFDNPGFEYGTSPYSVTYFPSLDNNWQTNDAVEVWGDGGEGVPAYAGGNFIELNANFQGSSVFQVLVLLPDTVYEASWYMHSRWDVIQRVELVINTETVASFDNSNNQNSWAYASFRFKTGTSNLVYTIGLAGYSSYTGVGNFIDEFYVFPVIFPKTSFDNHCHAKNTNLPEPITNPTLGKRWAPTEDVTASKKSSKSRKTLRP